MRENLKWFFFLILFAPGTPPLQHAALLITVLMRFLGRWWSETLEVKCDSGILPSLSSLYPPLILCLFSKEWIHPIHPETMAFCSSFCSSCRPAFLYHRATTARAKWRGVPPRSRLLFSTCPGNSRAHHILLIYLSHAKQLKAFIRHIISI